MFLGQEYMGNKSTIFGTEIAFEHCLKKGDDWFG